RTARSRLSQHRLRAVHARRRAGRRRARGTLVVGKPGEQGMRTAPAPRHLRPPRHRKFRTDAIMSYATLTQEPATVAHAPVEALAPADAHHLAWLESEAIH